MILFCLFLICSYKHERKEKKSETTICFEQFIIRKELDQNKGKLTIKNSQRTL
jgi:hypothetical protein